MSIEQILLSSAVSLFFGLMMTRVLKPFKLPDVTAYLIAGVLIGTFCLGRFVFVGYSVGFNDKVAPVGSFNIISDVALGFIAFDIGNEFRVTELKKTGKQAAVIGVVQGLAATALVDVALIITHSIVLSATGKDLLPIPACIILGAIATATAPAATLMVVRQYKAKGPLTDLLLPIVALDDAVGLVVFAVSFGVAQAMQGGALNVVSVVVNPLLEIVCSLALGAAMGSLLTLLEKLFFSNKNRLSLTIAFVMMTIALSTLEIPLPGGAKITFSSLLVCMMLGTMFCNLSEYSVDIMKRSEEWTAPLYAVFFVLSGAQLDLGVFRYPSILLIGLVFILVRCAGKYLGAWGSATIMGCEPNVRRYLGITLFPQAGVALGMVVTAQALGQESGAMIRNIILFAVLVYELVGPLLTKQALMAAGEVATKHPEAQYRARFEKKAAQ